MSQSDPVTKWTSSGDQTGLEDHMLQLRLDGGGSEPYPDRPDEADCIYYLRTGVCGFGSRCRFNHPRDRGGSFSQVFGPVRSGGGDVPERFGEPVCQYYMRTGICKFGASCKYHHPRYGVGSSSNVPLNISGYPLRPGEKECSYYIKTGQCKFGVTCKFHHPPPTTALPPPPPPPESLSPALYPSSQQYGVYARPSLLPGSYYPGPYSPVLLPPGMVPFPGWNPYQAPASPNTVGPTPFYAMAPHVSPPVPAYTGSYLSVPSSSTQEHSLPERPGEPECQHYLRTGVCKFGSSCRYHHPPEWTTPSPNFVLSPMGLPLRPGAPLCTHYSQRGVCKFGPGCKFDHPMGLSIASTLAPSSSSSDLVSTALPSGLAANTSTITHGYST